MSQYSNSMCYALNICADPPPRANSYVEILTLKMMVLGRGPLKVMRAAES